MPIDFLLVHLVAEAVSVFCTTRRVEFRDTDAAGIMHFAAFFGMMESAEHEMIRSLGLSVMPRTDHQVAPDANDSYIDDVTWPRVSARCDYIAAARFEDVLDVQVTISEIGNSSVTYLFNFFLDKKQIASGSLVAVCCRLQQTKLTKVSIPDSIRSKFDAHLLP